MYIKTVLEEQLLGKEADPHDSDKNSGLALLLLLGRLASTAALLQGRRLLVNRVLVKRICLRL